MKILEQHQAGLLRHSFLLLIASQIANVCNMLFQVLMMRSLTVTEYGILAAMLSLIMIIGTPLTAMRTAIAHHVALMTRQGHLERINPFLRRWAGTLILAAFVITVIGAAASPWIADFFKIPQATPVILAVLVMAGSLFMPLFAGALQGLQSFRWLAFQTQIWGVVRLLAALLTVVVIGGTAVAGLMAQAFGVLASIAVGLCALIIALRAHGSDSSWTFSGWGYFLMSLFVLSGFAVIMNADVSLVKRFFEPEEAGVFARAATIGRSIVFLPMPVAIAMFPKVVSSGLLPTGGDRHILGRAVFYTGGLIVSTALVCSVFIRPIWHVFTGEAPDAPTVLLARWVIWALAPLGLTFLLINFEIAQRRFRAPFIVVLIAGLYVTAVAIWHETFTQVLTIMTCVTVGSLLIVLMDMRRAANSWVLKEPDAEIPIEAE